MERRIYGDTERGTNLQYSIIIPTIREENIPYLLERIDETAGIDPSLYEVLIDVDHDRIGCPEMVARMTAKTKGEWVLFLGDDTDPEPYFLKNAVAASKELPDQWGLVVLNDGSGRATHWMCHKNMLALTGGDFFHTGYTHQFCDNELANIASEQGRYIYAADAKIVHNHPQDGTGEDDSDYAHVYSEDVRRRDQKLYLQRKLERSGISLGIGIPSIEEKVHSLFFRSFIQLEKPEYMMLYPKFAYHPGDIAMARNDLCRAALEEGCTHLLMMDTDQVYHTKDMIPQLLAHKLPIVGAKVHRRYPPFEPILNRGGKHVPDEEIEAGGLVEVDGTGTGCMLIETTTLLDLEYPWFEITRDGSNTVGEDINFCRKVKKKGTQIFVDCDIEIGHLSLMQVNETTYHLWNKLTEVKQNGND